MMKIKSALLTIFVTVIAPVIPLQAQESQSQEEAYYLVGWLNDWSTTDLSYPLTLAADGMTWEITVPAATYDGWFKIAPASAYQSDHFWHNLLNAPYDGCSELSGEMVFGSGGAWLLPVMDGIEAYTISMNPTTMLFTITPQEGESGTQTNAWSGTLPVLFINTEEPVTSKEVYVTGTYYIDALGLEGYQSVGSAEEPLSLQVKGRGNYTWTAFDKKPYRLKLAAKAQPLGMKSNKHFNLIANADDDLAFLRNTVGFELSRLLGLAYTPEQQPVELVLNGDYLGLYMLTDKIRVDKTRVNITEQKDMETDPEKVTGGWLMEIDNYDDEYQLRMYESNNSLLRFTLHSPEVLSDVQNNYMTQYLAETDQAIYNADKNSTLWESYIDMETLARFYIVQEVMDNAESFHGSCYMYKDRGADTKLMFGPVWDFGNAFRRSFDKFIYDDSPFGQNWIGEIAQYPRFQQTVRACWASFMTNGYATLDSFIDRFIDQISDAAKSDGKRWPQYQQDNINQRRDQFKYCLNKKVNHLQQLWDDASSITNIPSHPSSSRSKSTFYTLDGRSIQAPLKKGLYICNGRKVVVQ